MSTPANMAERTERGNSKDKTDSSYLDMQLVNQQCIHCTHSQTEGSSPFMKVYFSPAQELGRWA